MLDLLQMPNFIKTRANFSVGTKFARIYNFASRSSIPSIFHNYHVRFVLSAKFHQNWAHWNFESKSAQVFNFRSRSAISNIVFMINGLDLLWVPNFIAWKYISYLGPNFPGTKGLILVLMSNVCYLPVILIFMGLTWLLLLVT